MRKSTILLMLVLTACGPQSKSKNLVYKGEITEAYPAIVNFSQINAVTGGRFNCTGTFIGPSTLLTAAHCVDANSEIIWNGKTSSRLAYPATFDTRDSYSRDDIALVEFSEDVAPASTSISLRVFDVEESKDEELTIVGFGRPRSGVKTVGQNTIATKECGMLLTKYDREASRANVLSGDSGGALLRDEQLLGVTSAGVMVLSDKKTVEDRLAEDKSRQSYFTSLQLREVVDFLCQKSDDGQYSGIPFPDRDTYCEAFAKVPAETFDESICREKL